MKFNKGDTFIKDGKIFKVLDKLGEGGQGIVYLVNNGEKDYAFKLFTQQQTPDFIYNLKNKNNEKVMSVIVEKNPRLYKLIGKHLKTNYNVAKIAVSKMGKNYAILDERLKDYPELIELALIENNDCMWYNYYG